jgi:hypothetical protein
MTDVAFIIWIVVAVALGGSVGLYGQTHFAAGFLGWLGLLFRFLWVVLPLGGAVLGVVLATFWNFRPVGVVIMIAVGLCIGVLCIAAALMAVISTADWGH